MPIETPLRTEHEKLGAHFVTKAGEYFGCALPASYGDANREYEFARESVALIDKNYRAVLAFTGKDRARYLNAMLTNNIRDLAPGQGNISLLLSPQGRILVEVETLALEDRLLVVEGRQDQHAHVGEALAQQCGGLHTVHARHPRVRHATAL